MVTGDKQRRKKILEWENIEVKLNVKSTGLVCKS